MGTILSIHAITMVLSLILWYEQKKKVSLCGIPETLVHGPDWAEWKFIVMFLKKKPQSKSLGRNQPFCKHIKRLETIRNLQMSLSFNFYKREVAVHAFMQI